MALAATQNFGVVDQLLDTLPNPAFADAVADMGSASAREMLRYLSSEVNRSLFGIWGLAQLPLGAGVLWLLWGGRPGRHPGSMRSLALVMLALAIVLALALTPPIVSVGRELDFVRRDPAPPLLRTFGLLHLAYSVAEFLKLGIGLVLAFRLAAGGREGGREAG
jgi:hypothetical protein